MDCSAMYILHRRVLAYYEQNSQTIENFPSKNLYAFTLKVFNKMFYVLLINRLFYEEQSSRSADNVVHRLCKLEST